MRTHAPPDRAIDGRTTRPAALGRSNDVLAARRLLAVVELARRSRRGDGRSGSSGAMTQDEAHRQRRLRSSHDMTSGGPRAGLVELRSMAGFPARWMSGLARTGTIGLLGPLRRESESARGAGTAGGGGLAAQARGGRE